MADEARQPNRPGEPLLVEMAGGERRPIPDPTVLTTQAVDRALAQFRVELKSTAELLHAEIDALRELNSAHFAEVHRQLDGLETARVERKADNEAHLTSIFNAQQLAIEKNERAVKEQLDQLRAANEILASDVRRSINDNKDTALTRISLTETRLTAVEQQKIGAKDNSLLVGGGVAVVLLVLALMGWIASHNNIQTPVTVSVPAHASAGQ